MRTSALLLLAAACSDPAPKLAPRARRAAPLQSGTVILDEPLATGTSGERRGGTFTGDGWRADGHEDTIIFHVPTVSHGAIEFEIRGLFEDECRAGMEDKAELFHMYDWTAGDADNVYAGRTCEGYRNTPFKHFIRKAGCLEAFRNRDDSMEELWQLTCFDIAPNLREDDTAVLSWDPNHTYLFREEWGPDGAGNSVITTWRDGERVLSMSLPGAWEPAGHAVRLAASPRAADYDDMGAPLGAVYSNFKMWDLGEGGVEGPGPGTGIRGGPVRLAGNSLVDDGGAFLGLGFSYMSALRFTKYDRDRLRSDLALFSGLGFNYFRMLSMVGYWEAWQGIEIAPIGFTGRAGVYVPAWPDYWQQLRDLIDIAWDEYGLRTQITIFADAQLMPNESDRYAHMDRILNDVLPGREHKVILLEVANEAWQNGFPGEEGVAQLREFTTYLHERTNVAVAISSDNPYPIEDVYVGSHADIATWHFSRDLADDGWYPMRDVWAYESIPGMPPLSSNEPIGPGSSVASDNEPVRLVAAAVYAYIAKLPMYVFHSHAGVFGRDPFEGLPGMGSYHEAVSLLPGDVASWQRWNGGAGTILRHVGGAIEVTGARKNAEMVALAIGVGSGGVTVEATQDVSFRAHDLLSGTLLGEYTMRGGERLTFPQASGAILFTNAVVSSAPRLALTQPEDRGTFQAGATLELIASVTGEVASVTFFNGTDELGADNDGADGWRFAWSNVPAGRHTLTATATSPEGATSTSAAVTVIDSGALFAASTLLSEEAGLTYDYYEGDWDALPDFSAEPVIASGTVATFDIGVRDREEYFGLVFSGFIDAPRAGLYTFGTSSDDGSVLSIDGSAIVWNDGLHGPQLAEGEAALAAGMHAIEVAMFEKTGGEWLEVFWQGPGLGRALVPASALWHGEAAPEPSGDDGAPSGGGDTDVPAGGDTDTGGVSAPPTAPADPTSPAGGCGCAGAGSPVVLVLAALAARRRRRL
jgi:hypothetical protein